MPTIPVNSFELPVAFYTKAIFYWKNAMGNESLARAKDVKDDEFYTGYEDIKKELVNYTKYFKGKVIYCNCDDHNGIGLGTPKSNFLKYLADNFEAFKIKKVIATHYEKDQYHSTMYILDKDNTGDGITCFEDITEIPMKGNGDFRSEECIELLKQADIVITNPPFSLFREYVAQLIKYDKKFLIIGNDNCRTYKEIFPLIKENKFWCGLNHVKEFSKPDGSIKNFGNVSWYTNLENSRRNEIINTGKKYYGYEDMYPKYDNYDAINVDKVSNIPMDYDGVIGVPITFLDKYNPKQFEILGCADYTGKYGSDELGVRRIGEKWLEKYRKQGGKGHYTANMTSVVYYDNCGEAKPTFKRILIQKRKN